ncbi:MAG TPA: hypothetical protein VJQ26_04765, partial [Ktedonobacteraceae bacterium]|nr:hypothetical protein [Ktedonobacteraceae bacterium]
NSIKILAHCNIPKRENPVVSSRTFILPEPSWKHKSQSADPPGVISKDSQNRETIQNRVLAVSVSPY